MQLKKSFVFLFALLAFVSCQLSLNSPTLLKDFSQPATADEVVRFGRRAAEASEMLTIETIGKSESGKPLVAIKAAAASESSEPALRVLIFAQQHGNEQSGKEAALLLISDLARGEHQEWFPNLELWIVPQVNPDGSDVNERLNAGGIDLNRDHVVQHAPETRALHALFRRVMPHVTIDIHEYQPFRESWEAFGAYKTFDVQAGIPTNPNVNEQIRAFALTGALPALEKHLNEKGYSFHNYLVGPVPTQGRTRHSTVDFNDGRQSFAMLGTLSFIYEGINGTDGYSENLERRTHGQHEALLAMLNFLHNHSNKARLMVENARQQLKEPKPGDPVAIRLEHFPGDAPLLLHLTSSLTTADTLVVVENYHPIVKPTLKVERPEAYLIPRQDTLLVNFLKLHQIQVQENFDVRQNNIRGYQIVSIEMSEDEELSNRLPKVKLQTVEKQNYADEYLYIPVSQLHSNILVSLLEPQSMLGLAQRPGFEYLLKEGTQFPVLRVEGY